MFGAFPSVICVLPLVSVPAIHCIMHLVMSGEVSSIDSHSYSLIQQTEYIYPNKESSGPHRKLNM